jgi:hypothetical protein
MYWEVIGLAAVGVIWSVSEPTTRLMTLYKRDDFIKRLITCAMCSTWHIYFWYILVMYRRVDILGASVAAILAEFVVRKLRSGNLL